jgi:hypothetical protein
MEHRSLVHQLTDDLLAQVKGGARAVVWLKEPDTRFTRQMPFWREAIHVFAEGHPLWERVPHEGHADMRFFSVATDWAIDLPSLQAVVGAEAALTPVWRRFDARKMMWAEYVVAASLGQGRMFVSTLPFAGGLGHQPDTLETNPMGSWILASLLELLSEG